MSEDEKSSTQRIWKFEFKWNDLWVGAYWDKRVKMLYVCPLPCLCIVTWRQSRA